VCSGSVSTEQLERRNRESLEWLQITSVGSRQLGDSAMGQFCS